MLDTAIFPEEIFNKTNFYKTFGLLYAWSTTWLFVTSPKTKQVLAFNTATGKLIDLPNVVFQGNAMPTGIIISGNKLLVTDAAGNGVQEFDLPVGN